MHAAEDHVDELAAAVGPLEICEDTHTVLEVREATSVEKDRHENSNSSVLKLQWLEVLEIKVLHA